MGSKDSCPINCELFGRRAAAFESWIVPLWKEVYDSLVTRGKVMPSSMALDIGTGSGEIALRLAKVVGKGGRVVAIDSQNEMLRIAKRKARSRGVRNIDFKRTSMEKMDLPDGSFDSALGNYSLCCCSDYKAALSECLRVLKPKGRLTYNHGGPLDSLAVQVLYRIFEGYKTKAPSKSLAKIRASNAAQVDSFKKYRDPFVPLDLMRSLGYSQEEATLARYYLKYKDSRSMVDEWLLFDWDAEAKEIPPRELERFRREAIETLRPLSKGPGFRVERDVVFFTGVKR